MSTSDPKHHGAHAPSSVPFPETAVVDVNLVPDEEFAELRNKAAALKAGLAKVLFGKPDFLDLLLAAFFAGGHVLIEDLPGLGKTTVARTLARLIRPDGAEVLFKRIQFTPDLLPYDITGVDVFDAGKKAFVFAPGPVFTAVLLADEINRTTPRVQSALLEVMAESQVTVGGKTYRVDPLFFVVATQNPLGMEGTFPLPAAQLDRFMMRLSLGFPDEAEEKRILLEDPSRSVLPGLQPVVTRRDILDIRAAVQGIHVAEPLAAATARALAKTRQHPSCELPLSPRAGLMLLAAARGLAFLAGRRYVTDQDLADLAPQVLAHRMRLRPKETNAGKLAREVVVESLAELGL